MFKSRLGFFVLLALFLLQFGTAPAESSAPCSVPLKLRRGIPFAGVMLNGRGPFTFAVDTGTSTEAIISPALARSLRLPVVERTWLTDLRGKERIDVEVVVIESVALPGHLARSVRAMVHQPLPTLQPYDGVLGFAFFRDTLMTLDFPRRCLRLEDAALEAGTDPDVVPFSLSRKVPVVELTIGDRTVPAQIDSAGGGINLPDNAAPGVEFAKHTEVLVRAQTHLGTFFLRGGVLKGKLAMGAHVFQQPFVEVNASLAVGNLGAASLQDFAITFDQRRRLVRFRARKNTHHLLMSQLGLSGLSQPPGGAAPAGEGN